MCTAITYKGDGFYFGRTLDCDLSYGEEVVITPRRYFCWQKYAIIGMAHVEDGYPLYYDAVNEMGLALAGLRFTGYSHLFEGRGEENELPQYELITKILGCFATVSEALPYLRKIKLTSEMFREKIPSTALHYILADSERCIVIEPRESGLSITENPVGVMTNSPPIEYQLASLSDYLNLTPNEPTGGFSDNITVKPHSLGLGAVGLPGDYTSRSRFIRAAFMKLNSPRHEDERRSVAQFFGIMDTVTMPLGCCVTKEGKYEYTMYTSCIDTGRGKYHYKTFFDRDIKTVDIHSASLDGEMLVCRPVEL